MFIDKARITGMMKQVSGILLIATLLLALPLVGNSFAGKRKKAKKSDTVETKREYNKADYPAPDDSVAVDQLPRMFIDVAPDYPMEDKKAGHEGTIWIKVLVEKDGTVLDALLLRASEFKSLDNAAMAVAYKNKFKPAMKDGEPIAMWITYKVNFEIDLRTTVK